MPVRYQRGLKITYAAPRTARSGIVSIGCSRGVSEVLGVAKHPGLRGGATFSATASGAPTRRSRALPVRVSVRGVTETLQARCYHRADFGWQGRVFFRFF